MPELDGCAISRFFKNTDCVQIEKKPWYYWQRCNIKLTYHLPFWSDGIFSLTYMNIMSDQQKDEDDGAQQLITRLAVRIAEARKLRGFPRRVLSEKSGVSPRYLAQLEAGDGNISVRLLHRVSKALDVKVDVLLADAITPDQDAQRVAGLFASAPAQVQQQVIALLGPQNPNVLRTGRVCLIGLRGAGKSTLGRMAGAALNLPFVELKDDIECAAGMPLAEIMAFYGEAGYRKLEAEALERVSAQHDRVILAVAGGLVAEPATYARLLGRFHTVWIKTSPAEHMQRVRAQGDLRPMEGNPQAMAQLKALLTTREALYRQAEVEVNTANRTKNSSLNDLLAMIASRRFLDAPD
jgi:XRE family aerobic/anaerobic benzoate catabolism transcriptional regulator